MKYLSALLFTVLMSCGAGGDCTLLVDFSSHEEAIKQVRKSSFVHSESIETPKSSWIKTAFYYSCDNKKGFLIIRNKEDFELIFQDVPKDVWEGFKVANSHGTFANDFIIGSYPVQVK